MTPSFSYIGSELEVFSAATNWKAYWGKQVKPYLGDRVLEVGAGIGTNTKVLCTNRHSQWLALEPDSRLAAQIRAEIASYNLPNCCQLRIGTVSDLEQVDSFDSIIYIDVLEHIKTDRQELEEAATRLKPGGYLVVLAPAHQWLYTAFDQSIGHYRRYIRSSLLKLTPIGMKPIAVRYLDAVGLLASLTNKLLLKKKHPSQRQIIFWDQYMVTLSQRIDPLLGYQIGKSVLVVWQKN